MFIPNSVSTIEEYAFKNMTKLVTVTFADEISLAEISTGTFYNNTALKTVITKENKTNDIVTIPGTVTTLGDYVFFNILSAVEVVLPAQIEAIGKAILGGAGNVTHLTTPFIGDQKYGICEYEPTYDSEKTVFGYFFGAEEEYALYDESIRSSFQSVLQRYGSAESMEKSYYIPTALQNVSITHTQVVHYGTFYNVAGLEHVVLPEELLSIEAYAFYNAKDLKTVFFGEDNTTSSLTEIGASAFEDAVSLTHFNSNSATSEVSIPSLVKTLNDKAFMNCNSIEAVIIPATVGTDDGLVGAYVFAGCDRLSTIEIHNHWIGAHMFDNEDNFPEDFDITKEDYEIPALREVTIPANVTKIDEYAFANNSELRIVNIQNKVLGEYQFFNCPRLTSVRLPDDLTEIGEGSFGDCISLVEIWIPFVGGHAYSGDGREALLGYIFGTKSKYSDAVSSTNALVHATEQMLSDGQKETFYIPASLRIVHVTNDSEIGYGAFSNCEGLSSITLSDRRSINGTDTEFNKIGAYAFAGCINLGAKLLDDSYVELEYFAVPATTTVLGEYAFKNCESLSRVEFAGDRLTKIEDGVFYNCYSLTTIHTPGYQEDLKIHLGDSVTELGNKVFFNDIAITEITLSDHITLIGEHVFGGCGNLVSLDVPFIGKQMKDACTTTENDGKEVIFSYFFGKDAQDTYKNASLLMRLDQTQVQAPAIVEVPISLKNVKVRLQTVLHIGTFFECDMLVNITLPYCLEKIEDGAFYGSQNIEHVDFDNTTAETKIQLTSIGISAFHGCESMVRFNETDGYKVYIPAKVTKLSTRAFYHCDAIESVYIPEQIGNEVGDYVFAESEKLATVSINNTKVGKYMFYNDSALDHVVVPDKVTSIGYAAFGGCSGLTELTVPYIGAHAYTDASEEALFGYIFGKEKSTNPLLRAVEQKYSEDAKLETYYVPKALQTVRVTCVDSIVGYGAFMNFVDLAYVSLQEGDIKKDTFRIEDYAFYNCTSFEGNSAEDGLVIPTNTNYIGAYAFYENDALAKISYDGNQITELLEYTYYGCDSLNDFNGNESFRVILPESITTIEDYAFANCVGMESLDLVNVTSVGDYAFYMTKLMNKLDLRTLNSLGEHAFDHAEGLLEVILPASLTEVGTYAFANTYALENLTILNEVLSDYMFYKSTQKALNPMELEIPAIVVSFGNYIFAEATNLEKVTMHASMSEVAAQDGKYMFKDCSNLREANFTSGSIIILKEGTFQNASSLEAFALPETIVTIEDYAFDSTDLEAIEIAQSVVTIGKYAYRNNAGVRELNIPANVKHIGYAAFNGCGSIVKATLPFIGSNAPDYASYAGQSGSESLFGYIFGREAYENATLIHQFMKNYNEAMIATVKRSFKNELGQTAYDTDGYGNYINEALEVTSSPSVYGEAFWVPSGLAKVEFLDTFTKITNGQMSGVTTLYDVKLPYHINEIETAAFSGETNLRYINIPKPAVTLHEAVFENMYEGSEERPNEIFFITASYNIDGGFPEGWVTGKDMPVPKKWHTKYIVYYEEDSDIFEYEYDSETGSFKIIGFTEELPIHVLTHRDVQYSRYILRIPELKCQHPVVEITDEALLGYNDELIDYYFELLQSKYDDLNDKKQLSINGIAIAKNIEKLGHDIIQGGESFVAYVSKTKTEAVEAGYITEEEWLGGATGLVYYGEGVTWTLDNASKIYQLLLSATEITLDLDSLEGLQYDPETGYFITYTGEEFEPKPVIRFDLNNPDTVRVGNATLPTYDIVGSSNQGQYLAKYWNNIEVSYDEDGNVIADAWVYVFTNNTAIFTNRIVAGLNVDESKWCDEIVNYPWYGDIVPSMDGSVPDGAKLSFKIIRRVLSVEVEDEKIFEEGEIWENSDWSSSNSIVKVSNFATNGEEFNGTLRLNAPDVNVDNEGNVIAYTNMLDDFNWENGYTVTKGDVDLSKNYEVQFKVKVLVKPKEIMVNWKNLDTEYKENKRFVLPVAYVVIKDGYDPYTQCPIWVDLFNDDESGKTLLKHYLCDKDFISEILDLSSAGILSVEASTTSKNYILLNNYNVFIVDKITVDTPSVYSELTYDKINYNQYLDVSISDLYDYYLDDKCTIKIAGVPYGTPLENLIELFKQSNEIYDALCKNGLMGVGDYKIYAKLKNPNTHQWRDYRNPLYREPIYTLRFSVDREEIYFSLGDIILEYQTGLTNLNHSYIGTTEVRDGDIVYATHALDFKFTVPNEKGKYAYNSLGFALSGNHTDQARIDNELIYRDNKTQLYYSTNYRIILTDEIEVVYPTLSVKVSDTQEATYEETRNESLNGSIYVEGIYTAAYGDDIVHNFLFETGRGDARIEYCVEENQWVTAYETCTTTIDFKDAGTYTLQYRIYCEHYKTIYGLITLKILKNTSSIEITNKDELSKVYDTLPVMPNIITTGSTSELMISYRKERTDLTREELDALPIVDRYQLISFDEAITAGNWLLVVNLPADDNFEGTVIYQEFTIEKRNLDIEVIDHNRIYNKQNNYAESLKFDLVDEKDLEVKFKFSITPNMASDVLYTFADGAITIASSGIQVFFNGTEISISNFEFNFVIEIIIVKTTPQVEFDLVDDMEYNGKPYQNPMVMTNSESEPIFMYYKEDGTPLTEAPVDAGAYKLRIVLAENTNTLGYDEYFDFIISPKVLYLEWGNTSLEYTGSFLAPTVKITGADADAYEIIASPHDGYDGVSIGNQVVDYTLGEAHSNYQLDKTSLNYTIKIRKITIRYTDSMVATGDVYRKDLSAFDDLLPEGMHFAGTIETTDSSVGTYTGFGRDIVAKNVVITNALGEDVTSNFEITYYMNIKITNPYIDHNVKDGTLVDGVWEVSYDYDKKSHGAVVETNVPGAQVLYMTESGTFYSPQYYIPAIDMEIMYIIMAPNYETTSGMIHFVINPVQLDIEFDEPDQIYGKKFDGKDIHIGYQITPFFAPSRINFYKDGLKTQSTFSIGTYTVEIIVDDTANYKGFVKTFEYVIEPNHMNISIQGDYLRQPFNGKPVNHPSVISSVLSTDENTTFAYYLASDTNFENPIDAPYEVGTYVVVVTVEGNAYYLTTSKAFTFEIVATQLYIRWEAADAYYYNGKAQKPKAFAYDLEGTQIELDVLLDHDAIYAGTYLAHAVLPEGYPNYDLENTTFEFTILPYELLINYKDEEVIADTLFDYNVTLNEANNLLEGHEILFEFYLPGSKRIPDRIYDDIRDLVIKNLIITADGVDVTSSFHITYAIYLEVHLPKIDYYFEGATYENGKYVYEKDFDGIALTPELVILTDPENCLVTMDHMEYISAGRYELNYTIALAGHETVESKVIIIINRMAYDIQLENELDKTYDGVQVFPEITVNGINVNTTDFGDLGITVFINYYVDETYLGYVPVDAGTYTIDIIVCQTENYRETHMSYTFTIARAEGGIKLNTLKDGDYDFIKAYDGNLMSISAKNSNQATDIIYEAIGQGAVSYVFYDEAGNEVPNAIDAGVYYIQFFVEEFGNYNAFVSEKYSIHILKKIIFFGDLDKEFSKNFDGEVFEVNADVFKMLEAKVVKEWIGEGAYAFYNVVGIVIEEVTSDLRIVGTISTISAKHGTYINANHFDSSQLIVYDKDGRDVTKNYRIDMFMKVEIKPAKIEVNCSSYETDFTGQYFTINPKPVLSEGAEEQYHILYSTDGINYQLSPVRYRDCGTYEIFYKVVFENYEEVEGSATITILKIEAGDVNITADISKEYDGNKVAEPSYTTNTNGTPTYTWFKQNEDGVYEEVESAIDLGHYKVRIDIAEGTNYLATSAEFEFDITIKNIYIAWTSNKFEYNGTKQVPLAYPTIAVKGGLDIVVTITGDDPNSIRRGNYIATATIDNPNYYIVNPTCEYTIDYQIIDIPATIEREYTGRPISIKFNASFTPSITSVINVGEYDVLLTLNDKDNTMWKMEDGTTSTDDISIKVIVNAVDLNNSSIKVNDVPHQNYTGVAVTPHPTITYFGIELVEGIDYRLRYKDNRDPGEAAKIIVTGMGNYQGEITITFRIRLTVFGIKDDSSYRFLTAKSADYLVEEAHKLYKASTIVVIADVQTETTIEEFLNNLTIQEGQTITVLDSNYSKVNPRDYAYTYVGTGFKIQLKENNIIKDVIYVSVVGDITGDGLCDYNDFIAMQNYLSANTALEYEYYQAADLNNDGYVDDSDLTEMLQFI